MNPPIQPLRPRLVLSLAWACGLAWASVAACAQAELPKATITLVGDADRFNIGQSGYCGQRTDIASPAGKAFEIPADKDTVFYIRSRFRTSDMTYTCEGDFSFMPEKGQLHIIRYTFGGEVCTLEMFRSTPGGTPSRMGVTKEPPRPCLSR